MTRDRVDERPFVAVRDKTHPAIVLWRARKFVYAVEYDNGIRVVKLRAEKFDREYELLHARVNGTVDEATEYDVQVAARKYLDWGAYAGITEVAERALKTILNRKGSTDMSNIEKDATTQGDTKVPTPAALGDALAAVATPKKASTKNGTTPEAKRASKVQVTPTKEKEMAKPAAKKEAPAKKATPAKKEAPTKKATPEKKLTTKAPAKKAAAPASGRGRPSSLDPLLTIRVLVEKGVNPRRVGGKGYVNWPTIAKCDGKTVGKYLELGGNASNLQTDIARGHVKLVK